MPLLTQHIVAEAAEAAGILVPARFVEVTGSTSSDLAEVAAGGAPAWSVLVAGQQEAGRGRLGRSWVSAPGQSLLVSVLLRPTIPPSEAPLLSLAAAVAAVEACHRIGGASVGCKWPNDIVASGGKLGGILPEASVRGGALDHVVLGLGVNVNQTEADFPDELRGQATSVRIEGGRPDAAILLSEYLVGLRRLLEPDEGLRDRVLPRYGDLCETLGRQVRATLPSGRAIEGRAAVLGPGGELVIEGPSGAESVAFGEIVHLDEPRLPGASPEG
jgi:BirA family biotin operon repressor/biotin-[acetyl-CoA-carboxylase] ligase